MSRPSRRGGDSERGFLAKVTVALSFVITWFFGTLAAELLGNQAYDTSAGHLIGQYMLIAVIVVVPLIVLVWGGIKLWQRRHPELAEPEEQQQLTWVPEPGPNEWRPPPGPIYDRADEVAATVCALDSTGLAVVCGVRDVGTSAVAEAAVQRLLDERHLDRQRVVRLDLRGRSSRAPDDARATAARILSAFGLVEPSNGTPELLTDAARRLHAKLAKQYSVLLLDNAAVPEEIAWLVPQWTERVADQPWLVVAGESAIKTEAPDSSRVEIDPLPAAGIREIWCSDTRTTPKPGKASESIDKLVEACRGRPRAIKAVALEVADASDEAEVGALLASLETAEHNPLVGIWRAILARTEASLSPTAAWLLRALAVLPVTGHAPAAITALLAAHEPGADLGSDESLPAPFEELRVRNFVVPAADGRRYRMPEEIRVAVVGPARQETQQTQQTQEIARVAVPALVRHHADLVVRKANRLHVPSEGIEVAKWLKEEEPTLRPLFVPEPMAYVDRELLLAVIDDLAHIADALEDWYVRKQQPGELLAVSVELRALANRADRPGLAALAAARQATAHRMLGERPKADTKLALVESEAGDEAVGDLATELTTRLWVEKALLGMAGGGSTWDTAQRGKALRSLEGIAAHKRHPGAGIALLNMGALHLTENTGNTGDSVDRAVRCLEKAEVMARERRDVGCLAQAMELRGIAIAGRDPDEAVRLWQAAQQKFEEIGEELGLARCLQHLGAVALVKPDVAPRLESAVFLLEESKRLQEGRPNTALVDEYLCLAREEGGRAAGRTELGSTVD